MIEFSSSRSRANVLVLLREVNEILTSENSFKRVLIRMVTSKLSRDELMLDIQRV